MSRILKQTLIFHQYTLAELYRNIFTYIKEERTSVFVIFYTDSIGYKNKHRM